MIQKGQSWRVRIFCCMLHKVRYKMIYTSHFISSYDFVFKKRRKLKIITAILAFTQCPIVQSIM